MKQKNIFGYIFDKFSHKNLIIKEFMIKAF